MKGKLPLRVPREVEDYLEKKKWNEEDSTKSPTGSLRNNNGKPNMSNIPPEFLLGMAEVLTKGEKVYGKNNWKLGNYSNVPYDSGMRHILKWANGESLDSDSGCHHLFHAAVNLMMCWYYEVHFPDMDNRDENN